MARLTPVLEKSRTFIHSFNITPLKRSVEKRSTLNGVAFRLNASDQNGYVGLATLAEIENVNLIALV